MFFLTIFRCFEMATETEATCRILVAYANRTEMFVYSDTLVTSLTLVERRRIYLSTWKTAVSSPCGKSFCSQFRSEPFPGVLVLGMNGDTFHDAYKLPPHESEVIRWQTWETVGTVNIRVFQAELFAWGSFVDLGQQILHDDTWCITPSTGI